MIDPQGVIVQWNFWIARASGINRFAAIGAILTDLFPNLAATRVCQAVEQAIERGMASMLSRSLNKSPFPLQGWTTVHEGLQRIEQMVMIKPIKLETGRHCLIQIFDVTAAVCRENLLHEQARETQRLVAENHLQAAELTRSNDELEQFAYAASHDLREPLRTIASFSQLLERQLADRLDEKSTEYLEFVVEGARRMDTLIAGLLEMSRVESRGGELEPIDCAGPVAAAVANLTVAIEDAGAEVRIASLPTVMADETQLIQLFQNLIANAIKCATGMTNRPEVSSCRTNPDPEPLAEGI